MTDIKNTSVEDIASAIADYGNSFNHDFATGVRIGEALQSKHRTLQATALRILIGVIVGIGKGVKYTDARNEQAVKCSQQIARMINEEELNIGYMI